MIDNRLIGKLWTPSGNVLHLSGTVVPWCTAGSQVRIELQHVFGLFSTEFNWVKVRFCFPNIRKRQRPNLKTSFSVCLAIWIKNFFHPRKLRVISTLERVSSHFRCVQVFYCLPFSPEKNYSMTQDFLLVAHKCKWLNGMHMEYVNALTHTHVCVSLHAHPFSFASHASWWCSQNKSKLANVSVFRLCWTLSPEFSTNRSNAEMRNQVECTLVFGPIGRGGHVFGKRTLWVRLTVEGSFEPTTKLRLSPLGARM